MTVFASSDAAEVDCTPGTLLSLATTDYEPGVWKPLKEFRLLADSCETGKYSNDYQYRILRAQIESLVGNHQTALGLADPAIERADRGEPAQHAGVSLGKDVLAERAVAYITRRSLEHRIVIVNERHHVSTDRLLTLDLLAPLADQGYQYLALEAAWSGDDVNRLGYATSETGYYINDVVFAEMVRAAISLGYEIVSYEIEQGQKATDRTVSAQRERDSWQARNIVSRIFDKDQNAKVLVHCGYGHLRERLGEGWAPMAYFLSRATGLDPLTVDQTKFSERGSRRFEHPVRTSAERKGLLRNESVVLVDGRGKAIPIDPEVDVSVLTPRTEYASGRPLWMTMGGRREPVAVAVPECADKVCVLEARYARRPDSVPLDRVEVARKGETVLFLPRSAPVVVDVFDLDARVLGRRELPERASVDPRD